MLSDYPCINYYIIMSHSGHPIFYEWCSGVQSWCTTTLVCSLSQNWQGLCEKSRNQYSTTISTVSHFRRFCELFVVTDKRNFLCYVITAQCKLDQELTKWKSFHGIGCHYNLELYANNSPTPIPIMNHINCSQCQALAHLTLPLLKTKWPAQQAASWVWRVSCFVHLTTMLVSKLNFCPCLKTYYWSWSPPKQ